jgi:hypothetical protein
MNLTKTMMGTMMAFAAGGMLLPMAAQAEVKPTIVVMHRNVQNQKDESNWNNLALDLAQDGYRVVSVAMKQDETAAEGRDQAVKLLNDSPEYGKIVLVGTAAASDAVSMTAEAEAPRVKSIVYVSADPAVPTLGPRTVSEPADLVGKIPSYQIRITDGKKTNLTEKGATMLRVREEGHSTLANLTDLKEAVEIFATGKAVYRYTDFSGYLS